MFCTLLTPLCFHENPEEEGNGHWKGNHWSGLQRTVRGRGWMEPGTERVLLGGVLHWGYETHREACLPFYLAHLAAQAVPEGYELCYGFVLDGPPANAEIFILKALHHRVSYLPTYLWEPPNMPEQG